MYIRKKVEVFLPKIGKCGDKYHIYFRVLNPYTNQIQRYRVYHGFKDCIDEKGNIDHADKLIKLYTQKLRGGWRPWNDDTVIYSDETEYSSIKNVLGNKKMDGNHIRRHISKFIEQKRLSVSKKSMESYVSKLRTFVLWLEANDMIQKQVYEIDRNVLDQFVTYLIKVRKLDRLSVDKYQQNLNQFFKFCYERKLIDSIPSSGIPKPPKLKDCAARPIADNDMVRILKRVSQEDKQFFLACMFEFFLCCRPGNELRLLKIEDLNLFNRTVHIREASGKTGARIITMPEALIELCHEYKLTDYPASYYIFTLLEVPGPTPLGVNYFNRRFRYFRDKLNLSSGYSFYSFKHTAAGKLLESGATIVEVKNHLGHSSFESTIHYIKRHFGERSEKVANFRPDFIKGI